MSTKEIENKAKRLKLLKNKQETLQQEIDQLEADLKAQLEAWGVDEARAGPIRVVWKFVNSSRFDTRRFKAENGNLYNMYMIPNSYRKFSVV
jgi:predicted phage-related endonuclease